MKIRVFHANSEGVLEHKMNEFLKSGVVVYSVVYSTCSHGNSSTVYHSAIMCYKERSTKGESFWSLT